MRRFLLLSLLLAGCDSQGADEQGQTATLPAGAQSGAQAGGASGGPAQFEGRARAALSAIVQDAQSARLANLRTGAAGALCGNVEAKQPDGKPAFRPFVVTPEGVAVVSTTAEVKLTDPEDPFPDFYIRWCASPAELARLQPDMIGGETLGFGAAPPPPEIPDVPPDLPADLAEAPAVAPSKERPAAQAKAEPPPRPPTPTGDDSFFNVVARPNGKE